MSSSTVTKRRTATKASSAPSAPKATSAKKAAAAVLKRADGPLKTADIVERVLATKGVALKGKTPAATIAAILATENGKADGLFVRTEPGTYALRS